MAARSVRARWVRCGGGVVGCCCDDCRSDRTRDDHHDRSDDHDDFGAGAHDLDDLFHDFVNNDNDRTERARSGLLG
jgi:hypothetical protein